MRFASSSRSSFSISDTMSFSREKEGRILTPDLTTYLVPLSMDMPEQMDIRVLEFADPRGPWGARGVGEMGMVCAPPAIVSAVNRAAGLDLTSLPLTPEKVFSALSKYRH